MGEGLVEEVVPGLGELQIARVEGHRLSSGRAGKQRRSKASKQGEKGGGKLRFNGG